MSAFFPKKLCSTYYVLDIVLALVIPNMMNKADTILALMEFTY